MKLQSKHFLQLIVALIIVATILYETNPPYEWHLQKVTPNRMKDPETQQFVGVLATGARVDYHNYVLFSTTTTQGGGVLSVGFLHMVLARE